MDYITMDEEKAFYFILKNRSINKKLLKLAFIKNYPFLKGKFNELYNFSMKGGKNGK